MFGTQGVQVLGPGDVVGVLHGEGRHGPTLTGADVSGRRSRQRRYFVRYNLTKYRQCWGIRWGWGSRGIRWGRDSWRIGWGRGSWGNRWGRDNGISRWPRRITSREPANRLGAEIGRASCRERG